MTGSFTHIFHPHNEKMFENASIDVIVFRYCKNNLNNLNKSIQVNRILYNDTLMYITNSNGLITFDSEQNNNILRIIPIVDTWGLWETSRCNETLK